jgi:hypothetical protein
LPLEFFEKTGTLPGGTPVTLNPKGSTGTNSVTAMYREASHPDFDHFSPNLRCPSSRSTENSCSKSSGRT